MKILNKLIKPAILGLMITLVACSNEDPISSTITNYPIISVTGEELVFSPQGEVFADPGAIATVGEEEVPVEITYTGLYNGETYTGTLPANAAPDLYTAEYSATNEDGFDGIATRYVFVGNNGDLVNSIEGIYRSTVVRNGATGAQYTDMEYVIIWKNADGTYEISDAIGGYYDIGRAYGIGYIAPGGIIVANDIAANDFSFPGTQSVGTFGGSLEITGMTVNPADNSIDFTSVWQADASTTYNFEVHLDQIQF